MNGLFQLGLYYQHNDDKRSAKRIYEELIGLTKAADDIDEVVRGIKFLIARWSIDWEEWDAAERLLIELLNNKPQTSGFVDSSEAALYTTVWQDLISLHVRTGNLARVEETAHQSLAAIRAITNEKAHS